MNETQLLAVVTAKTVDAAIAQLLHGNDERLRDIRYKLQDIYAELVDAARGK